MEFTNKPTIVVFGCTGTVGAEVMNNLSLKNCSIRGIIRNPERHYPIELTPKSNITYIGVNLKSSEQIKRACLNADAIFLLTATAPDQVEDEIRIIDAAIQAGVTRIVKLSSPIVNPPAKVEVSNWHRKVDNYLHQKSIDFCLLQPYAFMQNWERNTFTIQYFDKFYGSLGNTARNFIDARDVAEVAVNQLLSIERLEGKAISLSGPEAITYYEIAERLSYVTNRKIKYIDISPEEQIDLLIKRAKLPNWLAHHIVELDELALQIPEPTSHNLQNLINGKPRIMDAYLQESKDKFTKKHFWKIWN